MEAEEQPTRSETLVAGLDPIDQLSIQDMTFPREEEEDAERDREQCSSSFGREDVVKALEVVDRDSKAIAESFTSLFASLRLALSEVTGRSVDHMQCLSDASGHLQECALDAATKGNRFINSCLRLNEEMRGMDGLAGQLKILRRNVDTLELAVNRLVSLPR